jgi:hypothetical protein
MTTVVFNDEPREAITNDKQIMRMQMTLLYVLWVLINPNFVWREFYLEGLFLLNKSIQIILIIIVCYLLNETIEILVHYTHNQMFLNSKTLTNI